ncbi:MAG: hypothetical protein ACI8UG_002266, partial [Gammaproteobacteria bacterium]
LRLRSGAYYADLAFCRQPFYDIKMSVWLVTKQDSVKIAKKTNFGDILYFFKESIIFMSVNK